MFNLRTIQKNEVVVSLSLQGAKPSLTVLYLRDRLLSPNSVPT